MVEESAMGQIECRSTLRARTSVASNIVASPAMPMYTAQQSFIMYIALIYNIKRRIMGAGYQSLLAYNQKATLVRMKHIPESII